MLTPVDRAWFQRLNLQCGKPLSDFGFNFSLRRYTLEEEDEECVARPVKPDRLDHVPLQKGSAVQVDRLNLNLKAPGFQRSKLKHENLLSSFAFNFNLRRCRKGSTSLRSRWLKSRWPMHPWPRPQQRPRGRSEAARRGRLRRGCSRAGAYTRPLFFST